MGAVDPLRPTEKFLFARFVRSVPAWVFLRLFRVRVIGADRIPEGPYILAGNHISYADPMVLWCASPRPVHFMAHSGLWKNPILGWGLSHLWTFPVKRQTADRSAVRIAETLLERGEVIGIFPEGTRNIEGTADPRQGAAFIALRTQAPIVPVGIAGTSRIRPPGTRLIRLPKVTISYGPPINPGDLTMIDRKKRIEVITTMVMSSITAEIKNASVHGAGKED